MSRQSQEEVAAAARRRLELLRRELEQSGLPRVDDDESWRSDPEADELPAPEPVPQAGRHARAGGVRRVAEWSGDLVPEALRGRVGLGHGPAVLVVGLVATALAVTVWALLRSGGSSAAAPDPPTSSQPLVPLASRSTTASPVSGAAATPSGTPSASSGTVTVDVAGKVRRPGVATLPAGSRVVDALRRAGGARGGVDLSGLNLARVLVDGEQILVGRTKAAAPPGGLAASASTTAPPATGTLVNLNTATSEQLDTLPGVGPVTAQKILQWRAAHGAFSAVDELLEVDGIGEKTLADLAPLVTL
jgi:competence protein ComEA